MPESTQDKSGINWLVPLSATLIIVAIYLAMVLWAEDAEFFLSLLLIAPALLLVSIALIAYALVARKREERLTLLSTVAALWVTAVAMFLLTGKYDFVIRTAARWLVWSHDYKAEVLAQPPSANAGFRHIEWDSWGIVPAGFTTVYLVFDPSDSLSDAAKSGHPKKFGGIPCVVSDVNRLEQNWYTVRFYTDQDWSHCN